MMSRAIRARGSYQTLPNRPQYRIGRATQTNEIYLKVYQTQHDMSCITCQSCKTCIIMQHTSVHYTLGYLSQYITCPLKQSEIKSTRLNLDNTNILESLSCQSRITKRASKFFIMIFKFLLRFQYYACVRVPVHQS